MTPTAMSTTTVPPISDATWLIDLHFLGTPGVISAYLLAGNNGLTLIETGPASTVDTLRAGIRAAGFAPSDLTDILVSHIHLDHAGAVHRLVQEAPDATVYVHPVGRPHMIDPTKLWASASRIYGEDMERLWGTTGPVPEARVVALEDGQMLTVAGGDFRVLFTPGHASHHVAFWDAAARRVFTGDAAGVRLTGTGYVCPPVPPPDLDLEAWGHTIVRLIELNARQLCLTHFGTFDDPSAHLGQLVRHLDDFRELALRTLRSGGDRAALTHDVHVEMARQLAAGETGDAETVAALELATPSYMAAMGLERYVTKAGLV